MTKPKTRGDAWHKLARIPVAEVGAAASELASLLAFTARLSKRQAMDVALTIQGHIDNGMLVGSIVTGDHTEGTETAWDWSDMVTESEADRRTRVDEAFGTLNDSWSAAEHVKEMVARSTTTAASLNTARDLYIITVKLPRNSQHDPTNKKTGVCACSPHCTDKTGAHHSVLGTVVDIARMREAGIHITRTERVV